jgi:hypothetical protein
VLPSQLVGIAAVITQHVKNVFIFARHLIAARALSLPQLPTEIFDDICNANS